ncbi:hypothetical protein D3C80_1417310 [compost metagenome]
MHGQYCLIQAYRCHIQLVNRHCTADFIGNQHQRQSRRAVGCGDKFNPLRTGIRFNIIFGCELACIDVVHKFRLLRIGHIIGHQAADALQPDKGQRLLAHLAGLNIFRLRSFLGTAAVHCSVAVAGIEVSRQAFSRNLLKVAAAVIYLLHAGSIPDGEGTASIQIHSVMAHIRHDFNAVILRCSGQEFGRIRFRIE